MSSPTTRRRQRLSADERRDQLVRAALTVISQVGYQATNADAIAREAEVSKGLLWHYFEDLDDLMATAARRVLSSMRATVGADIDLDAPVPELLRAAIHRAAQLHRTHRPELRVLREIALNLRSDDGRLVLGEADYDELYTAQQAIFRRGQDDGDIRPDFDTRLLAVSYQGLVDTMLTHLDSHPDTDPENYAATVADLFLGGVSTTPPAMRSAQSLS